MHEVGIVNGILDTVIRAARGAGASRAVLVTLRIGDNALTNDVVNYVLTAANIGANFIPVIGQVASLIISLVQLGLEIAEFFTKKGWKYPDYINELYFVIKMFVTEAAII